MSSDLNNQQKNENQIIKDLSAAQREEIVKATMRFSFGSSNFPGASFRPGLAAIFGRIGIGIGRRRKRKPGEVDFNFGHGHPLNSESYKELKDKIKDKIFAEIQRPTLIRWFKKILCKAKKIL
jgi:hypothetical protein